MGAQLRVLRAHPGDTVSQTRARLAAGDLILDSAEAVWLVDSDRRLVGAVPLPRLLAADGARSLAEIAIAPATKAPERKPDRRLQAA